MSNIKIIRTWWGNDPHKWVEVPRLPLYDNEIVYVWGNKNQEILEERGFACIAMEDNDFSGSNVYGKKLQALDIALKHWGEVLLLDWDCWLLKPLDETFYSYLKEKPIQIPLYAHYKEPKVALLNDIPNDHPILKDKKYYSDIVDMLSTLEDQIQLYHWKWKDGLVIPNFGCVYSRDVNLGADLIEIAKKNNIKSLVEEFAMWKYANCSMEDYISKYHPKYTLGVSDKKLIKPKYFNSNGAVKFEERFNNIKIVQSKFNNYIKQQLKMNLYYEHL